MSDMSDHCYVARSRSAHRGWPGGYDPVPNHDYQYFLQLSLRISCHNGGSRKVRL